ncbi:glycosyltransferase family 4 protein [Thiocapsa bogorovii]|uniref:glycosyltransferase family 4 protein n=1 Tax=Thiocapsa bogorovii TaxID=521689 RepID=UPI001E3D8924|nr:glycosyltransferase family 4 protein [Thiocapsa bogorovii]UHD18701.1 glycosyltransferase family 4 protein [Thiocapsa bogorovii]
MTPRLLYVLHSGNLYGTERMALATLEGLGATVDPLLCAPPGPVLAEAQRRGVQSIAFANPRELALLLRREVSNHREVSFAATAVTHSVLFAALNAVYRRRGVHIHMVHGGTDERDSYGRKKILNHAGVRFVAVSGYVRERLVANGVRADRISVIENFLGSDDVASRPRRSPFVSPGIRHVLIVSRVDPIKRVDLLLDALDRHAGPRALEFRILGTGWDLDALRERARTTHPQVTFAGFSDAVPNELARSDLLLHLCPVEPFGLAILEAMAAGIPVLVPDSGGAGSLVEDGVSGMHFRADDADDLARRLATFQTADADTLNRLVAGADRQLAMRFSAAARIADYRRLFNGVEL